MTSIGVSPLFHIAGTGWNLMVMAFGGTVVLHREVDGEAILRDIGRYRVTHAILVPAILQLILARRNEGDRRPLVAGDGRVRRLADQRPGAARAVRRVRLRVHAGLRPHRDQRCGDTLRAEDHDPARPELLRSCGHPLPGVELRIVDPETGPTCADGGVGEVWIRERAGDDRVLAATRRRPPRRSTPTAGSAPATPATSATAGSTSTTG